MVFVNYYAHAAPASIFEAAHDPPTAIRSEIFFHVNRNAGHSVPCDYARSKWYSSITTPTPRRPRSSKLRTTRPRQSDRRFSSTLTGMLAILFLATTLVRNGIRQLLRPRRAGLDLRSCARPAHGNQIGDFLPR